jgi:hypothetical protein
MSPAPSSFSPQLKQSLMLYTVLTEQLPSKPDLSIIQSAQPCPELWPLVVTELVYQRRQLLGFWVSDGSRHVFCQSSIPEVLSRLVELGEGAIIHLKNAQAVYLLEQKQYGLEMDAILTLKEFDAEMQQQERRQRKRMKRVQHQLRAEGWLQDAEQTAEPATTEEESVAAVGADASATEGNEA